MRYKNLHENTWKMVYHSTSTQPNLGHTIANAMYRWQAWEQVLKKYVTDTIFLKETL